MPTIHLYNPDGTYRSTHDWAQEKIDRYIAAGYTTGAAPPLRHVPPHLTGVQGFHNVDPEIKDAIHAALDIHHSWHGRDNPIALTAFGPPVFELELETPPEYEPDTRYNSGVLVSYDGSNYLYHSANIDAVARTLGIPGDDDKWQLFTGWREEEKTLQIGYSTLSGAVKLESQAMTPNDVSIQFRAKWKHPARDGVIVGIGVNDNIISEGLSGFTHGLLIFIGMFDQNNTWFDIKVGDGSNRPLGGGSSWAVSNGATVAEHSSGKRLVVPVSGNVNSGHAISIVHHHGLVTIALNGVEYGQFQFDAETYPFRLLTTGDHAGEQEVETGIHYVIQASAGSDYQKILNFRLQNLIFRKPTIEQIIAGGNG